jgi:hypothetical protein
VIIMLVHPHAEDIAASLETALEPKLCADFGTWPSRPTCAIRFTFAAAAEALQRNPMLVRVAQCAAIDDWPRRNICTPGDRRTKKTLQMTNKTVSERKVSFSRLDLVTR